MKINITRLNEKAVLPTYGSEHSAGADLYACIEKAVEIRPGEALLISTGLAMEIPTGYVGLIYARSGLATKKGLAPSNKVGVIDSDYRGEIMVSLFNQSRETRFVEPNERIAQMVITPYIAAQWNEVETLNSTERGSGGFGSTGTH